MTKKETKQFILQVIENVFVLLMGVQILLGLVWMVKNMGQPAIFQATDYYLKSAETFGTDEYTGIIYPLLISFTKWMEGIFLIPYCSILYVFQLAAALLAGIYFVKRTDRIKKEHRHKKIWMFFCGLYMITFPLLLQMHLAVLPISLTLSVTVIMAAEGIYMMGHIPETGIGNIAILCGLWAAGYLLMPEYGWLLGVFGAGILIRILAGQKKQGIRLAVLALAMLIAVGVPMGMLQSRSNVGRMEKTVASAALHRFVWPNFLRYGYFWPQEIWDTFEEQDLIEFSRAPEAVIERFGPVMEEKYGLKEANRLYLQMTKESLSVGTKEHLAVLSRDFLVNICPQAGVKVTAQDGKPSLISWNYSRLRENAPILTGYYLDTALAGWAVMCLIGICLLLQKKRPQKEKGTAAVIAVSILFFVIWYTIACGMQDYKNMTCITFFWLLPIVKGLLILKEKAPENDKKEG